MARPMRAVISVILFIVLLGGGMAMAVYLVATRERPEEKSRPKVIPRVLAPPIQPLRDKQVRIQGFGTARANVRTEVTPLVGGRVIEVAENFRAGQYVRKGQVLVRIDPNDCQLALEADKQKLLLHQAQLETLEQDLANLKKLQAIDDERVGLAKKQLEKVLRLRDRNAAADGDVESAEDRLLAQRRQLQSVRDQIDLIAPRRKELEAMIAADRVQIRKAQLDLDRTVVRARMDARVISRRVEVDESIAPSAVCGEICATELVEVPVSVPAEEIRWLGRETMNRCRRSTMDDANRHDAEVRAVTANGHGWTWSGCIARIEAELDQATRTATVVVYVKNPAPASDQPRLELNTYCEVTLLGRPIAQAYYLPRTAVLPEQEVYVIDKSADEPNTGREVNPGETGWLAQRKIKVARFAADQAMILPGGGLEPGDRVVLEYLARPILGQPMIALDRRDQTNEMSSTPNATALKPPREEGR